MMDMMEKSKGTTDRLLPTYLRLRYEYLLKVIESHYKKVKLSDRAEKIALDIIHKVEGKMGSKEDFVILELPNFDKCPADEKVYMEVEDVLTDLGFKIESHSDGSGSGFFKIYIIEA